MGRVPQYIEPGCDTNKTLHPIHLTNTIDVFLPKGSGDVDWGEMDECIFYLHKTEPYFGEEFALLLRHFGYAFAHAEFDLDGFDDNGIDVVGLFLLQTGLFSLGPWGKQLL